MGEGLAPGEFSWALIMFGTNDIDALDWNADEWAAEYSALIEEFVFLEAIPVLSMIPPEQAQVGDGTDFSLPGLTFTQGPVVRTKLALAMAEKLRPVVFEDGDPEPDPESIFSDDFESGESSPLSLRLPVHGRIRSIAATATQ